MKLSASVPLLLLSCFAATAAQAGVTGKCTHEGKPLVFVDAYAALAPDPFDDAKKVTTLWLLTEKLDRAELAQANPDEIGDAIDSQVYDGDGAKLELRFDAEGKVVEALQMFVPPGTSRSISGNDVGEYTPKGPAAARVSGRFVLGDDDKLSCDFSFDEAIAGKGPPAPPPKPWGTVLPKGGGEPGKAYMAMHRATLAGDVDAMLALAAKSRADEMRKSRSQPDFPKMLEMVKAFEPAEVHIVSGQADATRAELVIAGKESDGSAMTGKVKLVREDGAWKIDNVSTKSKL